mmetsp:Transcript_15430/g.58386  ORF Transcript_15430/g.58386 Transcript_15430/m.58386 type:complete len:351 (-) Transcript_15430:2605-3657(-)
MGDTLSIPLRNSMNVPRLTGQSTLVARYDRMKFTSRFRFSSPRWSLNDASARSSPWRKARSPFSGKTKSNMSTTSSPSCSRCFARSDPPTMPVNTCPLSFFRNASTSGVAALRAGVRVPSTSKRTMVLRAARAVDAAAAAAAAAMVRGVWQCCEEGDCRWRALGPLPAPLHRGTGSRRSIEWRHQPRGTGLARARSKAVPPIRQGAPQHCVEVLCSLAAAPAPSAAPSARSGSQACHRAPPGAHCCALRQQRTGLRVGPPTQQPGAAQGSGSARRGTMLVSTHPLRREPRPARAAIARWGVATVGSGTTALWKPGSPAAWLQHQPWPTAGHRGAGSWRQRQHQLWPCRWD